MFFKIPRHQKREFQYQPRYFDAREEELKEKIRQHEASKGSSADLLDGEASHELRRARISDQFSNYRSASRYSKGSSYMSGFQRIALVGLFFVALYWLANKYLPPLMDYLTKEQRRHNATQYKDVDIEDLPADDFTPTRNPGDK